MQKLKYAGWDALIVEGEAPEYTDLLNAAPGLCASMETALCIRYLVGRPVETGTVFYFDLLNQEFETIQPA